MRLLKQSLTVFALVILALFAVACRGGNDANTETGAIVTLEDGSGNLSITTLEGETITFPGDVAEGKLAFLRFFNPDCPHCIDEAPVFARFVADHPDNVGLVVTVIITDSEERARETASDYGFENAVYDDSGNDIALMAYLGFTGTPSTLVINKNGLGAPLGGAQDWNNEEAVQTLFTLFENGGQPETTEEMGTDYGVDELGTDYGPTSEIIEDLSPSGPTA